MTHAMLTFVAPLALGKVEACGTVISELGNPAKAPACDALALKPGETDGVHFASLHAIRSSDGQRGYIVFEFTADGSEEAASTRMFTALGPMLKRIHAVQ